MKTKLSNEVSPTHFCNNRHLGTLKVKISEVQNNVETFGSTNIYVPKQDSQNRLRLPVSEGVKP